MPHGTATSDYGGSDNDMDLTNSDILYTADPAYLNQYSRTDRITGSADPGRNTVSMDPNGEKPSPSIFLRHKQLSMMSIFVAICFLLIGIALLIYFFGSAFNPAVNEEINNSTGIDTFDELFKSFPFQDKKIEGNPGCLDGTWQCFNSLKCILKYKFCDGFPDCADESDEAFCVRIIASQSFDLNVLPQKGTEHTLPIGYLYMYVNGELFPVCGSSFGKRRSDVMCEKAGFSSSSYYLIAQPTMFNTTNNFLDISSATYEDYTMDADCHIGQAFVACKEDGFAPRVVKTGNIGKISDWRDNLVQYSYIVALYWNGKLECQALLITHAILLGAAHCFHDKTNGTWIARLGTNGETYSNTELIREIDGVIIHEEFQTFDVNQSLFHHNDIALIFLERPVKFSPFIAPIELPHKQYNRPVHPSTSLCRVIGFAQAEQWGGQEFKVTVLEHDECESIDVDDTNPKYHGHLCVKYPKDTLVPRSGCNGVGLIEHYDQLLLCSNMFGETHLTGISSSKRFCNQEEPIELWTWITHFISWIDLKLKYLDNHFSRRGRSQVKIRSSSVCSGFKCKLGDCIYWWLRCDGKTDCLSDNSDEENCPIIQSLPYTVVSLGMCPTDYVPCDIDFYKKRISLQCIPVSAKCDLVSDCPDSTDESDCSCPVINSSTRPCRSGKCHPVPKKGKYGFNIKELLPLC